MPILDKITGGMDIIHLESGTELEEQLRQLNPKRKTRWYMRISRRNWLIIGVTVGSGLCCGAASAALTVLQPLIQGH